MSGRFLQIPTLATFTQPEGVTDCVHSLRKLQDDPFGGDAANSCNDSPAAPGAKPMGPFYELDSSLPAALPAPGASPLAQPPHSPPERAETRA